jgi:GNAT superfamily N-acetyltransferase
MSVINIQSFESAMTSEAAQVLARAFVDNPIHVAAFGEGRHDSNEAFFRQALAVMKGPKWVALEGSRVLGLIHWVDGTECQFSNLEKLKLTPKMIRGFGLPAALRVSRWLAAWSKLDPRTPHVHLGPIGVDPDAWGQGIGQQLMAIYIDAVDKSGLMGYLETDRPENVDFYRRFGFETTEEVTVLGVRNYFMARPARRDD